MQKLGKMLFNFVGRNIIIPYILYSNKTLLYSIHKSIDSANSMLLLQLHNYSQGNPTMQNINLGQNKYSEKQYTDFD